MADRYWVGGTAAWDATAGTKWALTSGGAGGQAVPTAADNVYLDAASGVVTVTIADATFSCLNFICTGFTGTLTGTSAATLVIYGNFLLVTGMIYTYSGRLVFAGAALQTLTSAGKTLAVINIGTSNIATSVILADTLTLTADITVLIGTFDTNSNNINGFGLISNSGNTRAIYLRNSVIALSAAGNVVNLSSGIGLTFDAGTSQVNCTSGAAINFRGNTIIDVTFYNVAFTGTTPTVATAILGLFTFNNLSFAAPSVVGYKLVTLAANYTINGTLSTTGTAGNRRVWIQSATADRSYKLTLNSAPNLTDVDFKDIDVVGTAAPISGTRIGDRRNNTGITFDAGKNCYRIGSAAASNWSDNQWSVSSGGSVSTDYFPLPQDTAVINQSTGAGNILLDVAIPYFGTLDSSTRTTAISISGSTQPNCYGDIKTGSGITYTNTGIITFSGRNTQTITSNGKSLPTIFVDSIGGSVELTDAILSNSGELRVTNGTFNSKNYNLSFASISSNNTNIRSIILGSSIVTLIFSAGTVAFNTSTNLTFDAGTSTINCTAFSHTLNFGTGLTFYNVALTNTALTSATLTGTATFNTLSFPAVTTTGLCPVIIVNDLTIGTLVCSGSSAIARLFLQSSVLGTQRTLTIGAWSSPTNVDIRDIKVVGAVGTVTGTRLGDCQGNSGITFDAPKTVYWNLAGTQNWAATGWAATSGGTPDINNFPLAQDTAVFDNTGSVTGTISSGVGWNIGTLDTLNRTTAMTLFNNFSIQIYGSILFGVGVSPTGAGQTYIRNRGTSTITSNGVSIAWPLYIDTVIGTVQLSDAITLTNTSNSTGSLALNSGTFNANGFNVTTYIFNANVSPQYLRTLKMGAGTWTVTGLGTCWNISTTLLTFYKDTANIVLSDNTTTARTFTGGGLTYNKLTIGGNTSTSTTTISSSNQFSELASTKTVAHTIAISGVQSIGTWSVTGTVGNVVTLSTAFTLNLIGGRSSGINYLNATAAITATSSLGEFYMGANSTAATSTGVFLTAPPTPVTRYWRGGTGTWDLTTTTNWSDTSGGAGGFSVPTSVDNVIFDSASNATAYTVTCTATLLRCANLTFAAPASGAVTWAGTAAMAIHDSFALPATGLTRTFNGALNFTGTGAGKTITTNGVILNAALNINGFGSTWNLNSGINLTLNSIIVTNGTLNTGIYNHTLVGLSSVNYNDRTINLGSSTLTLSTSNIIEFTIPINLTFTCESSTINATGSGACNFIGGGQTFNTVSLAYATVTSNITISGDNIFNNLTVSAPSSSGLLNTVLSGNQTITGTLTCSGATPTRRIFIKSDIAGRQRTLNVAAWTTPTDCDVQDVLVTGAVAPLATTRFGDCKGNSGITFPASKNCYRKGTGTWYATQWAATSTGTPDINYFPLAQDIAYYTDSSSTGTHSFGAVYNLGSIVCTNTTTAINFNLDSLSTVYGDITLSSATTPVATGNTLTFAGRNTQTITSAGKTFGNPVTIDSLGGTVEFADAFNCSNYNVILTKGTLTTNYGVSVGNFVSANSNIRTLNMGIGTWNLASTGFMWDISTVTNIALNASSSTINLTNTTTAARYFMGGGFTYNNLNIGGTAGTSILSIDGNNTFNTISSTKTVAHTITFTQGSVTKVANWNVSGTAGNLVTLNSPTVGTKFNLIKTGGGTVSANYLNISDCYASPKDTWNVGSPIYPSNTIGWLYTYIAAAVLSSAFFFMF